MSQSERFPDEVPNSIRVAVPPMQDALEAMRHHLVFAATVRANCVRRDLGSARYFAVCLSASRDSRARGLQ